MLLLRMTIGGWAPLGSILEPAQGWAHWKAALPPAFIRWAVCVEEVLTRAFVRMGADHIHWITILLGGGAAILPLSCFHEFHQNVLCLLKSY